MSIYFKESPNWFYSAMESIWDHQTVRPDEIILVQDGPLTPDLYKMVGIWKKKIGDVLKCIPLEKNVGLGDALNIGLQYCSNELVARMDTDDIAISDRFEKQLTIFQQGKVDICSSWVTEFDIDKDVTTGMRKLPEFNDDIIKYAKLRSPINHPAVMYKKSAVINAGGYRKMMWFEDYYLWARMIITGSVFYNIQEPLVHMRAGQGQLDRRSGMAYAESELRLLVRFRHIGFLNYFEYYKAVVSRVPIRLLPKPILSMVYNKLR